MKRQKHRHAREGGHPSPNAAAFRKAGRWTPACAGVTLIIVAILVSSPAFADHDVTGDFAGKMKCENGMKKAGFKDTATQNTTWYTLNEISHTAQALSWDDSMSFDDREKRKLQLQHVVTLLHNLDCDTQDNPAQEGTGLGAGAQNGTTNPTTNSTVNGTTKNSYDPQRQAE
jgi:hypothetical protein